MDLLALQNDVLILAILLLLGYVAREVIKPLQKLYIPSSVIGGVLGLILGQQVLGIIEIPEMFKNISSVTINIILASMIFGISLNKKTVKSFLDFTTLNMIGYSSQLAIGTALAVLLGKIWTSLPRGWGSMGVFAFFGGHGVVAIAGESFRDAGVADNMGLGMILATFGLITAVTVGMVLVNWGIRKGHAHYLIGDNNVKPLTGGLLPKDQQDSIGIEKVPAVGINNFTLQFSLLMLALFIGFKGVGLLGNAIPALGSIPNTTRSMIGAAIVWAVMVRTNKQEYVDKKTMSTISSFALEITVIAAISTLRLDLLTTYLAPIVIFTATNIVLMLFISIYIAPRITKVDWFEKMVMNFGQSTGDTSTGYALLRCVDPKLKSSAPESLGVASTLTMPITGMFPVMIPYLVLKSEISVIGIGILMTIICLVLFRLFFYNDSAVKR